MAKITQLPDYLIRQIAAGEVIAEPLSVIKEAIENSIDAGATEIQVDIKNGGIASISIADNGSGISKEDLEVITTRHSTSKIKTEADLQKVLTLGFRGEFLASLLAAADLTIITKENQSDQAYKASFKTNEKPIIEATSRTTGTTLQVNNLFDKIPARRNFLPKPKTSIARIHEIIRQFALAYPKIRFNLRSDGGDLFKSQPGDTLNAITLIFGNKVAKNLLPITGSSQDETWSVTGFISKPVEVRATRSSEYFFVNGRIIENLIIQKALEDGYRNFLAPRKFPIAILYFNTSPEEYDANVHPAKKEIRIKAETTIYEFVMSLVYSTLTHVMELNSPESEKQPVYTQKNFKEELVKVTTSPKKADRKIPFTTSHNQLAASEEVQEETHSFAESEEFEKQDIFEEEELSNVEEAHPLEDTLERFYDRNQGQMGNEFFIHVVSKQDILDLEPVLQLDKTFIIAYSKISSKKLFLIDQHAVAERITLEQMLSKKKRVVKQSLLEPLELILTPEEQNLLSDIYPILQNFGYVLEQMGSLKVSITAVPLFQGRKLSKQQIIFNFREILAENLKLQTTSITAVSNLEDDVLKSIACHNSIRAGDTMSLPEMRNLLKDMTQATFPFVCCHGRPAIFKIRSELLHKLFWRT